MRTTRTRLGRGILVALGLSATILSGCTDTVFKDRPPFNTPPDKASGFLGYYTPAEQQTTCGNCHVGQQADWIQTKHASAWGDLQASGFANANCEGCHSVNSRGNQPSAHVGYDSVKTAVYHDVQCESCHGPGLEHVKNPTVVANRPIPSILVDTAAAVTNSSCGACHTDTGPARHHSYLKEWLASRHGQLRASPAGNAACVQCHEAKGALAAWGVNTVYKELGTSTLMPQNCLVCHDPHGTAKDSTGKPWEGQLRFPINVPNVSQNLCMKCHDRQPDPNPASSRGPHGTQGPVLLGIAGYFPPGSSYDTTQILTTHGSTANPRLCAGCHVNKLTGVDAAGNNVTFSGHSFHPLPCLQQKSPAVVDTTYTNNCPYDVPSRSWAACTSSGCHTGGEAVAAQRLTQFETERDGYIHTLWVDVDHDQTVDAFPADSGYLALVKQNAPNDLNFTTAPFNTVITPAKGALFNVQMLADGMASHPDGSHGVHNPFLYRALLQASIADLLASYPAFINSAPDPIVAQIQASVNSGKLKLGNEARAAIARAYAASRGATLRGTN